MPFFTTIPQKDTASPRDQKNLQKTHDTPFLALLLSKDSGSVIHETFNPLGYYSYSIEKPFGGMKTTYLINRKTVRRLFKERFFGFRFALTQSGLGTSGYELRIEDAPVRFPNSFMSKDLETFGKSILRPFTDQEDPLLRNLKDVPLYSWLGDTETDKATQLFCPIDGPGISILKASIRTSRSNWDGLCGREWGFRICGDCLGVLGSLPAHLKHS
ncbi:MAG: hypothetical protein ORN23_00545 [Chthoniobacterales bacterium]|nr:hypothetical protein [Chthoniobacterales bacterium]